MAALPAASNAGRSVTSESVIATYANTMPSTAAASSIMTAYAHRGSLIGSGVRSFA